MRRFTLLLSFVAVALVGLFVAGRLPTIAQEATPPAEEFAPPEGVTFEGLAFGLAEALPPGPNGLALFRFRQEPGAGLDLEADPSYFLVSIESGAITFRVDEPVRVTRAVTGTPGAQSLGPDAPAEEVPAGTDITLEQGDAALFPPGAGGEARNDGQELAVGLVVSVGPAQAEGEATPGVGTPVTAGDAALEATPT